MEDKSEHLRSGGRQRQAGPVCPKRGYDVLWSCDGVGHHGYAEHGRNMQMSSEVLDQMNLYLETKGKESVCDQLE